MAIPRVAIVILNWNRWKDTVECLESIYQNSFRAIDVIVVDNGSEDGSIEYIREYCIGKIPAVSKYFEYNPHNKPIEYVVIARKDLELHNYQMNFPEIKENNHLILIKNEKNLGFAEGVNIGIRFVLGSLETEFVLVLNNDIVVDREFLGELIRVGQKDEHYGMIGPKVYYYDFRGANNIINFAGGLVFLWFGIPWQIGDQKVDHGQYERERIVDYIEGSCLLARTDMIMDVGLLNPVYFAYWEEADWCFRARKKGWNSIYAPKSKIWHRVSASSGGKINPIQAYYMARNNFLFMEMNATSLQRLMFLYTFLLIITPFRCISYIVRRQKFVVLKAFIRGIRDGVLLIFKT